ncbi:MAG TPA: hypothetical protein VLL95_15765 [Phnomibacter sp.]|nr:hypothetical protein [Phnomibacter sp.]
MTAELMKGVLRFVKGLFATCKEVGDVVLVDRLQFFRYTHFKKNQCWYSFFILLGIISASVSPCLADGGIGYKGIYINTKGTKTCCATSAATSTISGTCAGAKYWNAGWCWPG